MPPKAAIKELDENLLQIFAEKLQENRDQQDARHETITEALRSITDKLAGMTPLNPPPPEPPNVASSSNITNPNLVSTPTPPTQNNHPPLISPSNTPPHIPPFIQTLVPPFFNPHHPYNRPNMFPQPTIPWPPKLQLIPFDGSELLDWLFQAEQFFQLYQVSPDQRLHMVSFYMKGEALSWFKWAFFNGSILDWESFTRALEIRFGPSSYQNHQAELFKLRQMGTVAEFQHQFEKICNRVWGLSPEIILNCFISGLLPEIRRELAILRPTNIAKALGLAKLVEAKIKDSKPPTYQRFNRVAAPNQTWIHLGHPAQQVVMPSNGPPSTMPIKRLTTTQMQERRAQGLCFNCDEKFFAGHKCQGKQFLMLLVDDGTTIP